MNLATPRQAGSFASAQSVTAQGAIREAPGALFAIAPGAAAAGAIAFCAHDPAARAPEPRYDSSVRPEDLPCFHGDPYPAFYLGIPGKALIHKTWL